MIVRFKKTRVFAIIVIKIKSCMKIPAKIPAATTKKPEFPVDLKEFANTVPKIPNQKTTLPGQMATNNPFK